MQIRSIAFNNGEPIPPRYNHSGCPNPPLDIIEVPAAAKSLALIVRDPDGVHDEYFHWTVWDIDPQTTEILEASAPSGTTEGLTSAGLPGYVAPAPHAGSGTHHYIFELYALDTMLRLPAQTPADELLSLIAKHAIERTSLTGTVDAPR